MSYFNIKDYNNNIQTALNLAKNNGGGTVFVPDGTYDIAQTLEIFEGTHLKLSHNAVFRKTGIFSPMLLNGRKNSDKFTLYNGNSNITVEGGTFDARGSVYRARSSEIMFMHCKNIKIKDVNFINNYDSHAIELNSTKNGRVINCNFTGATVVRLTEYIQLDLAVSSSSFPHLGFYDGTACDNILVQGCVFNGGSRGVGSHSGVAGKPHRNIRIADNHFENMEGQAVRGYDWSDVIVSGNIFKNVGSGVECRAHEQSVENWTVTGNSLVNANRLGHGVFFTQEGNYKIFNAIVSDNIFDDCETDSIYARYLSYSVISNNIIKNSGRDGIMIRDEGRDVIVDGNSIVNSGRDGIYLYAGVFRSTVSNNRVQDAGRHGININSSDHTSVTNNSIYTPSDIGIYITATSRYCNISSNKVVNGGSTGRIYASSNCHNLLVSNNYLSGGSAPRIYITNACQSPYISENYIHSGTIYAGHSGAKISNNFFY